MAFDWGDQCDFPCGKDGDVKVLHLLLCTVGSAAPSRPAKCFASTQDPRKGEGLDSRYPSFKNPQTLTVIGQFVNILPRL
jgi:hypothetical protein